VEIRKLIQRRIRHNRDGVSVFGDINAVISANVDQGTSRSGHQAETRTQGGAGDKDRRTTRAD
jgi:hypothetical protein